jgi:hypothetical protein
MSRMRQALHIFRKDLRRYWPFVALLAVVLTFDAFTDIGGSGMGSRAGRLIGAFRSQAVLLLTVLMSVIVVHEDDVSSRGSFWSSRPIAPMGLLGAKALFVGVFLLGMPLAFQTLDILRNGSAVGLPYHLAESALYQGTALIAGVLVAVVTRDLKSALFLGVVVGFGVTVGSDLMRTGVASYSLGMAASRQLMGAAWVVAAGGSLIVLQFVTRNTRIVFVGLAGAAVISVLVVARSPVDFWSNERLSMVAAEDLVPALEIQNVLFSPANRTSRGPGVEGIDAVVTTVPNGLSFSPLGRSIRVFVDGEEQGQGGTMGAVGRPYSPAQRFVPPLEGYSWFGRGNEWAQFDVRVLSSAPGGLEAALASAGEVEISAGFAAYRPEVLGRLALAEGAMLRSDDKKVVVDSVGGMDGDLGIRVTTTWVRSTAADAAGRFRESQIRLVLVNDERKEYLLPSEGGGQLNPRGLILKGPTVRSARSTMKFKLGTIPGTDVELTRDWLDGAKILVYRSDYLGELTASVTADMSAWSLPQRRVRMSVAGG